MDFETKGLIIRSRVRWMEDGEKSSKYFCNLEKRSCEKKCIYKIKDESGVTISDQSDIVKEIHKYYHKLYSVENTVDNPHDINESWTFHTRSFSSPVFFIPVHFHTRALSSP